MRTEIHQTAIVDSHAEIEDGVKIGAYSIIGPHVKIGKNSIIGSHAVIEGYTTIGEGNQIFQFASVGSKPQDLKYKGEPSELRIGNKNIIREFTTLNPGTEGGGMLTSIGNNNLFMANSHVGHDCKVGNGNVFANSVALAGHVEIGERAILGGLSAVHQFVRVGNLSLISGGAMVTQDVPHFCLVHGDRAQVIGLNSIGLKRANFTNEEISYVKKAYRAYFFSHSKSERDTLLSEFKNKTVQSDLFIDFVSSSPRGICRLRNNLTEDSDSA